MSRIFENRCKAAEFAPVPVIGSKYWFVLAVSIMFLCGSVSSFGHQGVDHDSKDENGSPLEHDDSVSAGVRKTSISARKKSGGSRWGANFFPNPTLVTHEGKAVRFYEDLIKDKVVMINFIYATCQDSCPLATAKLLRVQQILGDRVGRDVYMYSITIDPENDTPEVLSEHVEKFNVKPGWLFLTGDADEIMNLRYKLGFHFEGIRDDIKDHNSAVLMGNQSTGQWMKRSAMDNPYFLAEQFGTWISNWKTPSRFASSDYSQAPQFQAPTMGENLFRSRCSACHSIGGVSRIVGGGDEIEKNRHELGPDLYGITRRRDRNWLARWLENPARMIAEKDPIATRLYAEFNNILMPNFHLGKVEVESLIEYMEAESRRLDAAVVERAQ